jgi:hypothetical protein
MSAQSPSPLGSAGADFAFDQGEKLDWLGGPKQRFLHNLAAIELLKRLETEGRPPGNLTPDEQLTLTRYSGWGDTEVFNHTFTQTSGYEAEPCGKLKGLLTGEEIASLRASTLNAHYTRLDVIRAIYEAIERLGLASWGKLRILEPAAGIGHFLGAMPATLAAGAERVAIELDSHSPHPCAPISGDTRLRLRLREGPAAEGLFRFDRLERPIRQRADSRPGDQGSPPERVRSRLLLRQKPLVPQARWGSRLHHFALYAG